MTKRRLNFEMLEARRVLAGNVMATVVSGELRVVGDGAANWVQINEIPGADGTGKTFQIIGKPFDGAFNSAGAPVAGTSPTLINGGSAVVVKLASADKLRITMNAGNDAVFVGTAAKAMTTSGLVINTGTGADYVNVQGDTNTGALAIQTSQATGTAGDAEVDADTVLLNKLTAKGSALLLNTGGGNDRITITTFAGLVGVTTVNTGAGADTLTVTGVNTSGVNLNMGASNDRDVATISQLQSGHVAVTLGGGNDLLFLKSSVSITGGVSVNGGDGTDELRVGSQVFVDSMSLTSIEIDNIP